MTKAEVFTDPAFVRLSEQQQAFVRALVENGGDKLAAAHTAYACKDDFTARTLANRALRKIQIRRLVDGYFGEELRSKFPSREELAALAWEHAETAEDGDLAHKWASLVARVMGYDKQPEVPAQSAPKPADLGEDTLAELKSRGLSDGTSQ